MGASQAEITNTSYTPFAPFTASAPSIPTWLLCMPPPYSHYSLYYDLLLLLPPAWPLPTPSTPYTPYTASPSSTPYTPYTAYTASPSSTPSTPSTPYTPTPPPAPPCPDHLSISSLYISFYPLPIQQVKVIHTK